MDLKDIEIKQQKLSETGNQLKLRFFGIDSIIDQVIESISSWYCMPEFQERPLVVNLWGMTGIGKSDLIRELVNLLEFQNRYHHFDMGELGTGRAGDLKINLREISERNNDEPLIITLDEFQINRSINEMGSEISCPHSRIIWKLLDDGILQFDTDHFYHYENDLIKLIKELHYWKERGLNLKNGAVPLEFVVYLKDKNEKEIRDKSEKEIEDYFSRESNRSFFSSDEIEKFHDWHQGEFLPFTAYKHFFKSLALEGLIAYFEDQDEKIKKPKTLNFTKSLIFVVGNLDEVYKMHNDYSSDVCPNFIHELSKKIDVPKVKEALLKRYRVEQISRLGNNHIIFPSLDSEAFRSIIDGRLNRISERILIGHDIKMDFDNSIKQWIHSEGVTPTQWARPLLSALKYGIEDVLPKVLSQGFRIHIQFDKVLMVETNGLIAEYFSERCKNG